MPITLKSFLVAALSCFFLTATARAEPLSLIRDAETEAMLLDFAAPLLQRAGVDPKSVRIHIVKNKELNAFVANGLNIFIHTGLLMKADNAEQVIGVLAHEVGHIAGGHLARLGDAIEQAQTTAIATALLGAAVGAASGRGDVATAVIAGGQNVAMKGLLSFSRAQESAADQWAMSALENNRQSARGLLQFMEILGDQELLVSDRQDPYVRTHPLTRERVSILRSNVESSDWTKQPPNSANERRFARIKAKLSAFIDPPQKTFLRYKDEDQSLESRYARAIAHYRKPDLEAALPLIDGLIAQDPHDPYFQELKGQILEENGRVLDALPYYRAAVSLAPDQALLRAALGYLQVEIGDAPLLAEAIPHLRFVVAKEPDNARAWKELAIAQGRSGNEAEASLYLAEYSFLVGRLPDAEYHAGRALKDLPKGSPLKLRAQDILDAVLMAKDKKKKR